MKVKQTCEGEPTVPGLPVKPKESENILERGPRVARLQNSLHSSWIRVDIISNIVVRTRISQV
jgi:hypothetical protein